MKTITLNVQGMSCGHCVNSVQTALKEIGATGQVDLSAKTVTVEYNDDNITPDAIKEAIEEQGYNVI